MSSGNLSVAAYLNSSHALGRARLTAALFVGLVGVTSSVFADTLTQRASVTAAGVEGNNEAVSPAMSADGRYVAFASAASNFYSPDTNGSYDVFVKDRVTGSLTLVSVSLTGTTGNAASGAPSLNRPTVAISGNGRYVAFSSDASDLVPGDTNGVRDIFLRDLQTSTTARMSISSFGAQGLGASDSPDVTDDGRYVVFRSVATNLIAVDTNNQPDIFMHDALTGATIRVSETAGGVDLPQGSGSPCISGNGNYVAFETNATILGLGNPLYSDVFRRDMTNPTPTFALVSGIGATNADSASYSPSISNSGDEVAFFTLAMNLGGAPAGSDVYVHRFSTNQMILASGGLGGFAGNGGCDLNHNMSGDGQRVAFSSTSTNVVASGNYGFNNIYVRDLQTNGAYLVSVSSTGGGAGVAGSFPVSVLPSLGTDGRIIAFQSSGSTLVANDTNNVNDVFVHESLSLIVPFCLGDGSVGTCPCSNNSPAGVVEGCLNSTALGGTLHAAGFASLAADSVVLTSTQLSGGTAIFIQGTTTFSSGVVFGDGLRCVSGTLKRLATVTVSGGSATYPTTGFPSISSASAALGDTIAPGSTRYYFTEYRDPTFCTSGTFSGTSSLSVVWEL